jgi:small subunit ribosomal protein S9
VSPEQPSSEEQPIEVPETVTAEVAESADATESAEAPEAEAPAEAEAEAPAEAEPEAPAEVEVTAESADEATDEAPAAPRVTAETAQTVGRRKEAVVRVRITPGTGKFTLNGKSLEDYFPNKVHQQLIKEPLVILEKADSFDIRANLHGGGITGQAGALRLGIARALIELDSEDRPALKKAGFLTRDPRVKERKKYGLKKARKAPQYSKR